MFLITQNNNLHFTGKPSVIYFAPPAIQKAQGQDDAYVMVINNPAWINPEANACLNSPSRALDF
jgi:hypothetical protein